MNLSYYKLGCLKANSTSIHMQRNEVYGVIASTKSDGDEIATTANEVYGIGASQ